MLSALQESLGIGAQRREGVTNYLWEGALTEMVMLRWDLEEEAWGRGRGSMQEDWPRLRLRGWAQQGPCRERL